MSIQTQLENYQTWLESLSPTNLNQPLQQLFNHQVYFKDPFNELRGLSDLQKLYNHKFSKLKDVEYRVHQKAGVDKTGYIEWRMYYQQAGKSHQINGLTKILLNDDQQIIVAIDYWDPLEFVYANNPVINGIIKLTSRAHKYFQAN